LILEILEVLRLDIGLDILGLVDWDM
jgi:hypothetical protein